MSCEIIVSSILFRLSVKNRNKIWLIFIVSSLKIVQLKFPIFAAAAAMFVAVCGLPWINNKAALLFCVLISAQVRLYSVHVHFSSAETSSYV